MSLPRFTRVAVAELANPVGASAMNTLLTAGDVDSDGRLDIVVSGRNGHMAWFENPGEAGIPWPQHLIAPIANLECGGLLYDLTGSGYPDVVNGGDSKSDELAWWENPGPQGGQWTRRVIAKTTHTQFHDARIGDVTGDGRPSLVFWNQGSGSLYWTPLPLDPRQSPWPQVRAIAHGMREGAQPEEGLAIADLDGDGRNEIVAGTHWYKHTGTGSQEWACHKFARGYISTVVEVGDLDADGQPEILLAEGDACIYGKPQGGKLAWFKPHDTLEEMWEEHVVADHLLDPHSLQVGDLCGNGHLDVLVGEIGVKETLAEQPPKLMIFENDGKANFSRHIIDEGTGTHHAKLVDFRNRGVLDIVSRPLHGPEKWGVFVWYNNQEQEP